jgi:uncharacterized membrane protein HdeD (DUF308 family)
MTLMWPIIVISIAVVGLGSYILVDGIISLASAFRKRNTDVNWDWKFLNGMFGIVAGVLTFFNPFIIIAAVTFILLLK